MPVALFHSKSWSKWIKFSLNKHPDDDFGALDEKARHTQSLPAPRRSSRAVHSGSVSETDHSPSYTYHPARPTALSDIGHIPRPASPAHPSPSVVAHPIPTYQNPPSSYSNHRVSHVSSNPDARTQPLDIPRAILTHKPLPPTPPPHPPSSSHHLDVPSLDHRGPRSDPDHYPPPVAARPAPSSSSDIGHSERTAWTDSGHHYQHHPYSSHSNPNYRFSLDDDNDDDLAHPNPSFATHTPASSSTTLDAVLHPWRRFAPTHTRKAHSDIGHGHPTSHSHSSSLPATHVPAATPTHATHSACPPSFSRHSFLAHPDFALPASPTPSSNLKPRTSKKLRKHAPSASAYELGVLTGFSEKDIDMDMAYVRPATMVVSPMGPPMFFGRTSAYHEKRPPPLSIPQGKENTPADNAKSKETAPKKPSLIRRLTLNRAAASSSSASASNEDSLSSAHDASTGVTTPDSGEMEFRWGRAVSDNGHGFYGKKAVSDGGHHWNGVARRNGVGGVGMMGKRARESFVSESTVSPRTSMSVSVFSGETVRAGTGQAQVVGGRRVSRKLTKRRRPSVSGIAPTTPVTPATPATWVSSPGSIATPGSSTVFPSTARSPSSTSLGWLSGGEGGGERRKRLVKKRRPNGMGNNRTVTSPTSPVTDPERERGYLSSPDLPSQHHWNSDRYPPHPQAFALDLSSTSYAAASAAMSPVSPVASPSSASLPFSSSVLSLGRASIKGKSRSRVNLALNQEGLGGVEGGENGSRGTWNPYAGHGRDKGKGKQREILSLDKLVGVEVMQRGEAQARRRDGVLSPPPPRAKRESVDATVEGPGASRPGTPDEEGVMRRWTMAFGDEDEEESAGGLERVRSRTSTQASSKVRTRSRAGSAVLSMLSWPEGSGSVWGEGEGEGCGDGEEGIEMQEMGVGIALTTSPSQEGSLRSGTTAMGRWRCSYDPRGSGMVYGVQGEEDEDEEDEGEEDEVWGEGREEWLQIRRMGMCCRELVRTERNYLRCLRDLMDGETQTPPSPLLLAYLPALLAASNSFLAHLSSDPTPYGVSAAFLGCEDEMEAAFVAWCGIVGGFFSDAPGSARGRKVAKEGFNARHRAKSGLFGKGHPGEEGRPSSRSVSYADVAGNGMFTAALASGLKFPLAPLNINAVPIASKKSVSAWRKSMPTLSNLVIMPTNSSGSNASTLRLVGKRKHNKSGSTFFLATVEDGEEAGEKEKESQKKKKKKPTVRDLAIQPVQRVMRYVLQYKEILNHTPASSPARALVERALEGATRIAAKCDRAQDNAAFLR